MRLSELAGIRYDSDNPRRSDVDLWHREITVCGKGRKTRTVKISHDAARSLDRYLRVRARHAKAHRPQLWLGTNNRRPMTASGIYQVIARRGRQCCIEVSPAPAPAAPEHAAATTASWTTPHNPSCAVARSAVDPPAVSLRDRRPRRSRRA
jgi:site-specific recombinase XerC